MLECRRHTRLTRQVARAPQESKYEEDYLSTIGVDFVRLLLSATGTVQYDAYV